MINETNNIMVPKLRFEEFEKEGEWVHSTVEENCLLKGRIGYRGYTTEDLVEKDKGALVLGGKHIQNQALDLSEPTFLSWDKYYESPEIMAEIGDIIFSQRGTLGDCAIIEKEIGPATINPSMVLLKNITCNAKFLYYIFIGDSIQKEVQKNRSLGAIPMLSQKQIKEFPFLIPLNPKEQQKIADCLFSLDDLITAESQKLEALKVHKKGLMQQLFPAEGETVPKLRFPEFKNDGEWKENILSKITDAVFDGTHQTPTYTESGIPFFSVENIVSGNKNKFISREDYDFATIKNKPEKGDILITRIGKIGFSAIVNWDYDFSIYVTLACIKQSKYFNSYYLHSYFQSSTYQKEIHSKSLLNAVPMKINMDELRKTKVLLPPDIEKKEQQNIADCLSSLDELITSQTEKIQVLNEHKKGLMQGLFPNTN